MCSFKLIYFIIFLFNIYSTNCSISDKRLCMNTDCSEPVSLARTLLTYNSPHPLIISFKPNVNIKVFSKEAGVRPDLWGVEINGRRGYVPKNLVREYKVFGKPTVVVDTELSEIPEVPPGKPPEEKVLPDKVKEPFEVVDGTTFFLDSESIRPSSTEGPILSTTSQESPNSKETQEQDTSTKKEDSIHENLPNLNQNDAVQGSVVDGVLSSIKNWINDDELSEEDEDEESEEDIENEDDEDVNVEDESEQLQDNLNAQVNVDELKNIVQKKHVDKKVTEEIPTSNEHFEEIKTDDINTKEKNEVANNSTVNPEPPKNEVISELNHPTTINVNAAINKNEQIEDIKPEIVNDINLKENNQVVNELNNPTEPIIDNVAIVNNEEVQPETIIEEAASETVEKVEVGIETHNHDTIKEPTEIFHTTERKPENQEINTNPNVEEIKPSSEENQIKIELPEIHTEKINEPTTLPSINQDDAIPILSPDEVTPNPLEEHIFSPMLTSFLDKKSDSINVISGDSHENASLEDNALNSVENIVSDNQIAADVNVNSEKDSNINIYQSSSDNGSTEKNEIPINTEKVVEQDQNLWSPEVTEEKKPEVLLQNDAVSATTESPEIPSITNWYSNVNTNIDSSTENTEAFDVPNEMDINALKAEGVLPNNLLGESQDDGVLVEEIVLKESEGMFDWIYNLFASNKAEEINTIQTPSTPIGSADQLVKENQYSDFKAADSGYCTDPQQNCDNFNDNILERIVFLTNSDFFLYLGTTAVSCIIFLIIYLMIDKCNREAPLVEKINKLEKELFVTLKEKDLLQDAASSGKDVSSEEMDVLKLRLDESEIVIQKLKVEISSLEKEIEDKSGLEDQIESLEKELENSTEVGMELNRIISEMLDSNNGGEILKENVEQLQRQLSEQKWIINDISKSLSDKEAENVELEAQLDASKKQTSELQRKLDEIIEKIFNIEKEREQEQKTLREEILLHRQKFNEEMVKNEMLNNEIQILRTKFSEAQRKADIKIKEYQSLKDSLSGIKSIQNDKAALQSLLDATSAKAELEQLKSENEMYLVQLKQEEEAKIVFEKKCQAVIEENNALLNKYQKSDKEKVEATMKLEVLNNYFKKREEELQSEILKYKSIWETKEGEATSTTERVKLMAEEIENYKLQNETLKREIVSQEIELKSQISILEKKVHENWVTSRQMERKLEDARQESAQLRNRLTLRERAIIEERTQNRLQSPIDQNGELTLSPPPIESPASPSMLFGGRDHITKSPPIPGLPPFLPPPPGVPFMPPPLHGMPFMPPPPSMFPGDHRPPPLGRMSSPPPPLNSRYSPENSAFSPYERNTPSPPYDSEYGASPPPIRGYSPYDRDDRRDYKRPMHISNGRNNKGSLVSSGSDNSNDSLHRKHSKMV